MTKFRRLGQGGTIDRSKTLNFKFNGKRLSGFAGDTLASALLANNQITIGRSFKYHRPRGILSAGIEETNALFTTGAKMGELPNAIGPMVELTSGLSAKSQNAWPSPTFDVMAINSLASPIFGAGFYYKTFMGPFKKSWMFYEPFIRRAAGLGKTTTAGDDTKHFTRNAFCDVLIVGSGPAGLSAALTAARSGLRVVLAEQDFVLGGQITSSADLALIKWRDEAVLALKQAENCRILTRATVQGIYDANQVIISVGSTILESLRAQTIIFATGAVERPLVFSNNDRPGVMLASALRTYLNRYALAPAKRAVIATNNDAAYDTAFDLAAHDVAVTMVDERQNISAEVLTKASAAGIVIFP